MPTFWSSDNESEWKVSAQTSIRNMMKMCQMYIPTVNANKWNIPKFHELLHIVDDISRFGAPMNYSADRPESLLIPAAKLPGRRSQKRNKGSSYEQQVAARLSLLFLINTYYNNMFVSSGDTSSEEGSSVGSSDDGSSVGSSMCSSVLSTSIKEHTRYATHATSRGVYDHSTQRLMCTVEWQSKTKNKLLTIPEALLVYMHKHFGKDVHFCTEYCRAEYTFRCHPSYQSNYPMYDWMKVRFNTGSFPCRLAAVVICDNVPDDPYRLVVQSTTKQTGVKSVLLTEWYMSDTYYVVYPESIKGSCFVIEHTTNNSKVHEVLSREKWAGEFTTMPGPDGVGYTSH